MEKNQKRVQRAPHFTGFKPFGQQTECTITKIELGLEEYEAIKLCDYDMLSHYSASKLMGISKSTFARVYQDARSKVAKAMIEASAIVFKTDKGEIDTQWLQCNSCGLSFSVLKDEEKECPFCKSNALTV